MPEKKSKPAKLKKSDIDIMAAFFGVLQAAVERIGLPGTVFIAFFYLLIQFGRPDQKQAAIDLYILWKNPESLAPFIALTVVFSLILLGQRRAFRKQLTVKDEEIERIGVEKSTLQTKLIQQPLHASGKKKSGD